VTQIEHVLCVVGARPNFMKVAPLLDALRARSVRTTLVHTGQHYDAAMSDRFFADLGLPTPDHHLGVGSGSHAQQTSAIMRAFEPLVDKLRPDIVVVVGDVNSTLACALVAAKAPTLLAHVEAGLRSRDWSMPEEVNRVVTDRVSHLLFAPSTDAVDNLRSEGTDERRIHLVGNLMVDTLLTYLETAKARRLPEAIGFAPGGYGLVTLHRPANVDNGPRFERLRAGITRVAAKLPLIVPVHPRARAAWDISGAIPGLTLVEPLGYLDFLALEAAAALVLTDSGGVQEETTVLGVPCLTLRDSTERPVTVTEGTNRVVGDDPDRIEAMAATALDEPREHQRPVAGVLVNLDPANVPRPTDLA